MAMISHLPICLSFPSFDHRKPLFYYRHHQQPELFVSYLNSTKKNGFVCFACSIKQTRVRKRVKSNEELRNEIMEFVALTGLPEGHVPSMKELSANGRADLANIVRRRGYKFIKELLENSDVENCNERAFEKDTNMEASASGIFLEDSLTEGQGKESLDVVDGNLSTEQLSSSDIYSNATNGSLPLDQIMDYSSSEVVEHGSVSDDDESSLYGVSSIENSLYNHSGEITEKDLKIESVELNYRADIENSSPEASVSVNHSLVLDDTSSYSDREADNVLETEDEKVNDIDEASISANGSLTLDDTSVYSGREDANDLVIEEASISANDSLTLDDPSSCSDREAENVLVTEDEEINDVDEASILAKDSLALDDTTSCLDASVLLIDDAEVNDVEEASANHSLTLDDSSSCSDREAENVLVKEHEDVNDVEEASISANNSLVLDDTSSCSDTEAENVLVEEDEEVNDVDEASISANHSLDTEAETVLMTEDEETNDVEEASISANHSLDTQVETVSMTEDEETSFVDEDFSDNSDHYTSPDFNYTNHVYIASEPLSALNSENPYSTLSLEEKTARFIQNGYLDTVDDDEHAIPNESSSEETTKGGDYIEDSYSGQRSVSTPLNGSALALEEVTYATETNSFNRNSDQRDENSDVDNELHDETMKRENQVEITRLRFMLRQKEMELSKLKEQIEKEKLSLSVLQREAETEINKAQMLISEKEAELQEAEESLSGLQEVEIEYCGDGNVVEVTGSFNGWQHRIEMELSKPAGKQKCWSTMLWLYPGTYEIKFVVDDSWTTNPQLDSVTRGHITNNILKVDR